MKRAWGRAHALRGCVVLFKLCGKELIFSIVPSVFASLFLLLPRKDFFYSMLLSSSPYRYIFIGDPIFLCSLPFCASLFIRIYCGYQHKLTAARLKKSTAQWFRIPNSARIFINLWWYDIINTHTSTYPLDLDRRCKIIQSNKRDWVCLKKE